MTDNLQLTSDYQSDTDAEHIEVQLSRNYTCTQFSSKEIGKAPIKGKQTGFG